MTSLMKKLGYRELSLPHFAKDDINCDCNYIFASCEVDSWVVAKVYRPQDSKEAFQDIEECKKYARLLKNSIPLLELAIIEAVELENGLKVHDAIYAFVGGVTDGNDYFHKLLPMKIEAIENATGRTWEDIKSVESQWRKEVRESREESNEK